MHEHPAGGMPIFDGEKPWGVPQSRHPLDLHAIGGNGRIKKSFSARLEALDRRKPSYSAG